MLDGECLINVLVCVFLEIFNWYGLIVGVMGLGKIKILQIIVEQLLVEGVLFLFMDIKGDLLGIVVFSGGYFKIDEWYVQIGFLFEFGYSLVEFFFLLEEKGLCLWVMVYEFGFVLFFKILGLNDI